MATIYADPVHYVTDTGWEEIDNTLKINTDGTYSNTAGVWDVRFPGRLNSGNSISIEKDGHSLSFALTGELRQTAGSLMRQGESVTQEITQMRQTDAQIETFDLTAMRQGMEYAEMVPEKTYARLSYANVYQNTDITYDLISNKVKESIILDSYSSTLQGYRYTLNTGDMLPVLEEDNSIVFYDAAGETPIMYMPAPYLVDTAGVFNTDIQVTLTGSNGNYILTYLVPQQWLSAEDRSWPVVLDPVVEAEISTSNIRDRTVAERKTYSQTWGMNTCGYDTDSLIIALQCKMRKILPHFP